MRFSRTSAESLVVRLDIETLQLFTDDLLQTGGFLEVSKKLLAEAVNLLGDRLITAIVDLCGPYEATRAEHMVELTDLFHTCGVAEAGDVLVLQACLAGGICSAPCVECADNPSDVVNSQNAIRTVQHRAHGAGINEEDVAATVVQVPGALRSFVFGEEP